MIETPGQNIVYNQFLIKDSIVWSATSRGIGRIQNDKFELIQDSSDIYNNQVNTLFIHQNNLYAGTYKGDLIRIDSKDNKIHPLKNKYLAKKDLLVMGLGAIDSKIFIANFKGNIFSYNTGNKVFQKVYENPRRDYIYCFAFDKSAIYISTSGGLYEFDVVTKNKQVIEKDRYYKIKKDKFGNLWAFVLDDRNKFYISKRDKNDWKRIKNLSSDCLAPSERYEDFTFDSKQNMWIAASNNKLIKYNTLTQKCKIFNLKSIAKITTILAETDSILWVGTRARGLFKVDFRKERKNQDTLKILENKPDSIKHPKQLPISDAEILNSVDKPLPLKALKFKRTTVSGASVEYENEVKAIEVLTFIANFLKKNDSISIELHGHTERNGEPLKLLELSERRVKKVKKDLIEMGITSDRIKTTGHGRNMPLTTSPKEQDKNRRVEIQVFYPDLLFE